MNRLNASTATYSIGRGGCPVQWIVVHYTGGTGSARNNAIYFSGGNRNASAHYFIDSDETWGSVPEDSTAWHAGNFRFNQRSIGIEVVSNGEDFTEGEIVQLTALVRDLMGRYGLDATHVIRHFDCVDRGKSLGGSWVDPHKHCPAPYIDDHKWRALWGRVTGFDGEGGQSAQGTSQNPSDATTAPQTATCPRTVAEVQAWLNANRGEVLEVDGIAGPKTRAALARFAQACVGADPDGYFRKLSQGAWKTTGTLVMGGTQGNATRAIQMGLVCAGYDVGSYGCDAVCGPDTSKAIIAYQAAHGLKADGVVGNITARKLFG